MEINAEQTSSQISENIRNNTMCASAGTLGVIRSSAQLDSIKNLCQSLGQNGIDTSIRTLNGMYFMNIKPQEERPQQASTYQQEHQQQGGCPDQDLDEATQAKLKAKAKRKELALQRWKCH